MTGIDLTLKSVDLLEIERPVVLEGVFEGTVEQNKDRFGGLGEIMLRLQPQVGARMMVGEVVLEAKHRKEPNDNVWVEAIPRQEGK